MAVVIHFDQVVAKGRVGIVWYTDSVVISVLFAEDFCCSWIGTSNRPAVNTRTRPPYLRHNRVLTGTQQSFDPEVLINPFEEQFNLPSLLVNIERRHQPLNRRTSDQVYFDLADHRRAA